MTRFLRLTGSLCCTVAALVAIQADERSPNPEPSTQEQRDARERWAAEQLPSPWEAIAEAQARRAAEEKRHRPACGALAAFLAAKRPLVEALAKDAAARAVDVKSAESFAPEQPVRKFLAGRRVLFADRGRDGRLRPSCDFCPSLAGPSRLARHLPEDRLARTPAEAEALVVITRHAPDPAAPPTRPTGSTDARKGAPTGAAAVATTTRMEGALRCEYDVAVIDPAERREIARYRLSATPPTRPPPAAGKGGTGNGGVAAQKAASKCDRLSTFMGQLLADAPDPATAAPAK